VCVCGRNIPGVPYVWEQSLLVDGRPLECIADHGNVLAELMMGVCEDMKSIGAILG
jgi:hypothetical protein